MPADKRSASGFRASLKGGASWPTEVRCVGGVIGGLRERNRVPYDGIMKGMS